MQAQVHPKLSPLQLNRYFIKRLAFSLNEGFDRRSKPTSKEIRNTVVPEISIGVFAEHNPDNEHQWRIELLIETGESEDRSFPYTIAATVVGYFTVDKKMSSGEAENLARVSGASMLYTTAREIIVNTTGRTQYPHLLLPTVTFLDLPEEREEKSRKPLRPRTTPPKGRKKTSTPSAKKK